MSNTQAETCTTCCKPLNAPHRRIVDGKIVEGCIAADHDGRVYGESALWHNRKAAKALRAASAKRLRELLK